MLHKTWRRLRLLGVVGTVGAAVILRWSAARLVGREESLEGITIGEHG